MRRAIDVTAGVSLDIVQGAAAAGSRRFRGARVVIETAFWAQAGSTGHGIGFTTRSPAAGTRLHPALDPQRRARGTSGAILVLVARGRGRQPLYRDVTSTLTVSGKFSEPRSVV